MPRAPQPREATQVIALVPCAVPAQVARGFLVETTRPMAANGFGYSSALALQAIVDFEVLVRILPEDKPACGMSAITRPARSGTRN